LNYEKLLLGNGKYVFSAAVYKNLDLNNLSTATYYDLLSRSFEFRVRNIYEDDASIIVHPCTWSSAGITDTMNREIIKEPLVEITN